MCLRKKMLAKFFGVVTVAMLLVGPSAVFAADVFKIDHLSTATSSTLTTSPIALEVAHVLILTGNIRAGTLNGDSSAFIQLDIVYLDGRDEREHCGMDRMAVKNISGFNLYASASCVRLLPPGHYVLQATHGVKNAFRKRMHMDYVLTTYP